MGRTAPYRRPVTDPDRLPTADAAATSIPGASRAISNAAGPVASPYRRRCRCQQQREPDSAISAHCAEVTRS